MAAVQALRKFGVEVLGVLGIFTYGFKEAAELFQRERVSYHTLTDYQTLLSVAVETGRLQREEKSLLQMWSENPIFLQIKPTMKRNSWQNDSVHFAF